MRLTFVALALGLLAGAAVAQERTSVVVEPRPLHLTVARLQPEGQGELLAVNGRRVSLAWARHADQEPPRLRLPGEATLWTVADLDRDGMDEFLVLVDGDSLHRLEMVMGELSLGEPVAAGLRTLPPRGVHSGDFLKDLDQDGFLDLVLPIGDRVQIFLGGEEGFVRGPDLGSLSTLDLRAGGGLLDKVSRRLSMPALTPEDMNGDGRPDLSITDGMMIRQYLLTGEGFPKEPTRSIDLSRFQPDLEEFSVDLGNLASSLRFVVQDKWADLDGDGTIDMMVLADGRIRIYLADEQGIDLERPGQILKLRGNVLYVYPARIDEDDIPDLVLVRIEDLGIGKLLRAALFSLEIHFDFLVFRGRGNGRFQTRPFRERSATLKGGSLLSIYQEEKEELSSLRQRLVRTCDLDGDGVRSDLVTLDEDGKVRLWRDLVSDESVLSGAIERFLQDSLSGEGEFDIDVATLTQWTLGRTSAMVSMTRGIAPDMVVDLEEGWSAPHAMTIRDLDGDGLDEVLALRLQRPAPDSGEKARLVGFVVDF